MRVRPVRRTGQPEKTNIQAIAEPMPMTEATDAGDVPCRLPKGAECECRADGCGLFFTSESAFDKHWTQGGHAHPGEVGLAEREHRAGPVWGWPAMPTIALVARQEGAN